LRSIFYIPPSSVPSPQRGEGKRKKSLSPLGRGTPLTLSLSSLGRGNWGGGKRW